jgi:hypothetical protein
VTVLLLLASLTSHADDPATPTADQPATTGLRDIHPALGLGATHRSNQWTGKLVPASVTWKDDRYEFFVAYFRDQRIGGLIDQGFPAHIGLAPPLWAFSLSRRFNVVDRRRFKSFFGLGVAYVDSHPCATPTESNDRTPRLDFYEPVYHGCDKLNGSRLNYALQLGIRAYNHDRSQGIEFAYRHISNAGMTSGNRGEDLLTGVLVF